MLGQGKIILEYTGFLDIEHLISLWWLYSYKIDPQYTQVWPFSKY